MRRSSGTPPRRNQPGRRCKPALPLASLRIGYIQKEFDGGGGFGGGGGTPSEAQRAAGEARRAMYAEALDVFRKAGAKLEPMTMPDFPARRSDSC